MTSEILIPHGGIDVGLGDILYLSHGLPLVDYSASTMMRDRTATLKQKTDRSNRKREFKEVSDRIS